MRRPHSKLHTHVFVSEDHNDALENIHNAIRRRLLPFAKSTILHIDAHPDLMAPKTMPASSVFDKYELYHQLACSESGIAEYILPAVYATHFDKMVWIRSPWSNQLRDGEHRFVVGAVEDDDVLRVDSTAPYFLDEELYAPTETLVNTQPLHLVVSLLDDRTFRGTIDAMVASGTPWVLDICLDYFSTNNPFYNSLERVLGSPGAKVVFDVFNLCSFRFIEEQRIHREAADDPQWFQRATAHQQSLEHAFQDTMDRVFQEQLFRKDSGSERQSALEQLAGFHDLPDDVRSDRTTPFPCPKSPHQPGVELFTEYFRLLENADAKTLQTVEECLTMLDLPDHPSSNRQVDRAMDELHYFLEELKMSAGARPAIVTIARSSDETYDYTPVEQVDDIEAKVIGVLKSVYGKLEVAHDAPKEYEEESTE